MITNFPINADNTFFGGLLKFWFIPVEDVLTEPEIFENILIGDYTLKPGKSFLTGLFDRESGQLNIENSLSEKGNIKKHIFSAEISDNSPELDKLFCEMGCSRYIVFVADAYKNVRVLGRVDNGAIFEYSFGTKDKVKSAPRYTFSFSYHSSCVAPLSTQLTDIC